jgi:hypothetical protein
MDDRFAMAKDEKEINTRLFVFLVTRPSLLF